MLVVCAICTQDAVRSANLQIRFVSLCVQDCTQEAIHCAVLPNDACCCVQDCTEDVVRRAARMFVLCAGLYAR